MNITFRTILKKYQINNKLLHCKSKPLKKKFSGLGETRTHDLRKTSKTSGVLIAFSAIDRKSQWLAFKIKFPLLQNLEGMCRTAVKFSMYSLNRNLGTQEWPAFGLLVSTAMKGLAKKLTKKDSTQIECCPRKRQLNNYYLH